MDIVRDSHPLWEAFLPDVALTETISQHQIEEREAAEHLSATSCENFKHLREIFFCHVLTQLGTEQNDNKV